MRAVKRLASLSLIGLGLLIWVPSIYSTIEGTKYGRPAWEAFEAGFCCSMVFSIPCFYGAWRIRQNLKPHDPRP